MIRRECYGSLSYGTLKPQERPGRFVDKPLTGVAREEDARPIGELALPDKTRVICIYRDEKFLLPEDGDRLKAGDEVVLITHARNLTALAERWAAPANASR